MIMIIFLVLIVSVYMMLAGKMKSDRNAMIWGAILFASTAVMLLILWMTVYKH